MSPVGSFMVTWEIYEAMPPGDIRASLFTADGTVLGNGDFSVLSTQPRDRPVTGSMAAVRPDGSYLVVWSQENDMMAGVAEPLYLRQRVVGGDGSLQPESQVNDPNPASPDPHSGDHHTNPYVVIAHDGSYAILWTRGAASCAADSTGTCEVRGRWFNAAGTPRPEISLSSQPSGHADWPVGGLSPFGYIVAWSDQPTSGADTSGDAIVARRFDPNGNPAGDDYVLNTLTAANQTIPAIASGANGNLVVLWEDDSDQGTDRDGSAIRGRALWPSGLPAGPDFAANSTTQGDQYKPALTAAAGGSYFAIWADRSMLPPDLDGGVRGRFLFPAFDRSDGVIGANCDSSHPCLNGLTCQPAGNRMLCQETCGTAGQTCPNGGICTAVPSGGNACLFQ
jgi:hypothetical protein